VFEFFQWSLYGYHRYFVHKKLQSFKLKYEAAVFALVLTVDAMSLEILTNISSNFLLNTFIFYYLPGDIGHLTMVYVYPGYLLGGIILNEFFRRFERETPCFFGNLGFLLLLFLCFYDTLRGLM
jgi:uncharacterized protein YybS (DUF2232 family)